MYSFIICWIITLVFAKVVVTKKEIIFPINADIVCLLLSLIISAFFSLIQIVFSFIITLILGG